MFESTIEVSASESLWQDEEHSMCVYGGETGARLKSRGSTFKSSAFSSLGSGDPV